MSFLNDSTPLLNRQGIPAGVSPATAAKRRERFMRFERWCAPLRLPALPTTANVLARYVEEHVGLVAYLTLRTRVEAIKAIHVNAGVGWLDDDEPVRWALESARHAGGTRASLPLVERDLADLADMLVGQGSFEAVRDWAIIAFGCEVGLDGRELAGLAQNDVLIDAAGAALPNMKSAWGEVPRIPRRQDVQRCPVVALEIFRALREPNAEAFFHGFDSAGKPQPLRAVDVNAIVARHMHEVGRDARRYSAASLKAHHFFGKSTAGAH